MSQFEEFIEDSEEEFREFQENPDLWEELEDVSEDVLAPEVSFLIADFESGRFDYRKFLQLSTNHRKQFMDYITEHTSIQLSIREQTA